MYTARGLCFALAALWLNFPVRAAEPPSRPGVDAPELAALGPHAVGVRTLQLTDPDQPDVMAFDAASGTAPHRPRPLTVDIWYPARPRPGARPETYSGALDGEQPGELEHFTVPGIAVRDAPREAGRWPLVLVSHGFGNVTSALTWLTENLASKGSGVAAVRHVDPPWTAPRRFTELLLRRPLDFAFVGRTLQQQLGSEGLIDPTHTALVGYSLGGYTVLTAGGATLDPDSLIVRGTPAGKLLVPYARGGKLEDALRIPHVQAVVALAPAGGGATPVWGAEGLQQLRAPMLLIAGNHDLSLDYASNAHSFFDTAVHAPRYLLTYREGGHSIGLNPAPASARARVWDIDWFEDPVWRKDRIIGINLHFITAFLDRYVKGDAARAAYLDVAVADSSAGEWKAPEGTPWDAYSPGGEGVTLWKGFQRRHATGLELVARPAEVTH